MNERLRRIHNLLQEGNVPSAVGVQPDLGLVLQAGVPDGDAWDVVVADTGSALWVRDARGTNQLPADASDAAIADTVKLHVVQAWADQGNPEAKALISRLTDAGRVRDATTNLAEVKWPALNVFSLLNPLAMAGQVLDVASYLGNFFLSPQPIAVDYAVWSPWGTIRGRYILP